MPMSYPDSLRQALARRLVAGESVARLSKETAISEATLYRWKFYRWKRQLRIDAGLRPGRKSVEGDVVRRLTHQVKSLEHELDLVKTASRLFDEHEVINPKGLSRSSRPAATGASAHAKRVE
jgi:transposase